MTSKELRQKLNPEINFSDEMSFIFIQSGTKRFFFFSRLIFIMTNGVIC